MAAIRPVEGAEVESSTLWCPSCGAEYVAGSSRCADCRVALVTHRPARPGPPLPAAAEGGELEGALVEIGEWPRLAAQILRRRLETAGIPVMLEWSGATSESGGIILVPEEHAEFAEAVVNEIEVDDEVPDTSPFAYVSRIEEHLSAVAGLLEELRTRLDELEAEGRL